MTSVGQKHKQVVKAQVRAVESAVVPPLSLPHYADPGSASSRLHSYHSLGRCLRSNVFPGALVKWKSLSQDSYISHPVTAWPADPHLWYGHRTDEMGECIFNLFNPAVFVLMLLLFLLKTCFSLCVAVAHLQSSGQRETSRARSSARY
ncbi:uncharacterized protein LOC117766106 isoform X1 [Hippoglossus hippoglossus]|uniref:uncharacterized protein LOC117766106 isoform X1 n=1 Tax=Hippoglossus hippoglossus TaxID=8267 RepID=UPI00148B7A53|nr:uncharacterized protein LOC117766106 isoform X1 [Hippoglossus hippoglossus]